MLKNIVLFAVRNFKKEKFYTLINILGLALGLTCVLFILLWVRDELSYDRFHQHAGQIYRVSDLEKYSNGEEQAFSSNPPDLAPLLATEYPEIKSALRLRNIGKHVIRNNDKKFNITGILCADSNFFEYFSFPLINGSIAGALTDPASIVLTEEMAEKYFGNTDALGKTLIIDNQYEYQVTGVLKKLPQNTFINFNCVIPFETIENFDFPKENWNYFAYTIFVRLADKADATIVSSKIKNIINDRDKESTIDLSLQPLADIHLRSGNMWGMGGNGDIRYVYIFSILAALVLLLACINFMNLSTARAGNRSMEVGLRKVIGAGKKELMVQFMGETLSYTLIAFVLAIVLLKLFSPVFASISGKQVAFSALGDIKIISGFLLVLFVTGIVAGAYPAFFMSSFQPVRVMKKRSGFGPKGKTFRRVLVMFQFIITIVLLASSLVINRQLQFIRNHKLGYNHRNVLIINLQGDPGGKCDMLKYEFKKIPHVEQVSAVSFSPANIKHSFIPYDWEGRKGDEKFLAYNLYADTDMAYALEIPMVYGRFFSPDHAGDSTNSVVINESAMRMMNFNDPIGKRLLDKTVIGVVKDFNFNSLHSKINPLIIQYDPEYFNNLLVRIEPAGMRDAVKQLKEDWEALVPGIPFEYGFVDEEINDYYKADNKVEHVINTFTVLALFIASLGLLGLAVFTAAQRTKEIGIRKVLGAPVLKIIYLISGEYVSWVLAANIIAWPVTFFAMTKWLQSFAYRVQLGWWMFAAAGAMVLLIALLSVSWQTIRAARANPIKALRYE